MAPLILEVDKDTVELVVTALEAEAMKRQRVATRLAGEVEGEEAEAKREGRKYDPRPDAKRVLRILGESDRLARFAKAFSEAYEKAPQGSSRDELMAKARAELGRDNATETPQEPTKVDDVTHVPTTDGEPDEPLPPAVTDPDGSEDLADVIDLSGGDAE